MAQPTLRLPVLPAHPVLPARSALAPSRRTPERRSAVRAGRDGAVSIGVRGRWTATQALVMVSAVAAYFLVRGATEAKTADAVRNAARLVHVEQLLGLDREHALQALVLPHGWLSEAFTRIYIYGHWPVIALTLGLLAFRAPQVFARTRNAMLLSGSVGLTVFLSLPVAPPRLAGIGLVDTVDEQSHAYRVLQPAAFTNQYAALPSLHVGWNLLMGLALWAAARHWWLKVLAVAGPLVMATAVVVTANHYLVDVVAGAGLATAAWLLAGRLAARSGSRSAAQPASRTAASLSID